MSFLYVLKKIGSVALGIEHVAVPIISAADPALAPILAKVDNWVSRTQTAVQSAEATYTAAKSGGMKSEAVLQDFQNGLQPAQDAMAIMGKTIEYDPAPYAESTSTTSCRHTTMPPRSRPDGRLWTCRQPHHETDRLRQDPRRALHLARSSRRIPASA